MNVSDDDDREVSKNDLFKKEVVRDTISWLVLMGLTAVAIVVGQQSIELHWVIGVALLITVIKGQIVSDVFMRLWHAPTRWRRLMLSYVILVPGITGSIFLYFT